MIGFTRNLAGISTKLSSSNWDLIKYPGYIPNRSEQAHNGAAASMELHAHTIRAMDVNIQLIRPYRNILWCG